MNLEQTSSPADATPSKVLRIAVAINPRASFGGGGKTNPGAIGHAAVTRLREAGHHVSELRRRNYAELEHAVDAELAEGANALVVVGGDGMVHLGVNALARQQDLALATGLPSPTTVLGIVPAGTGNDAARGLGLDIKNPAVAVERFLKASAREPRVLDRGRIDAPGKTPVRFMGALSAGFDALVNERANTMTWPRGPMRYNFAIVRELLGLSATNYQLVVDGTPRKAKGLLVCISNGTSIGGGMKITPKAVLDDGFLDLFLVDPVSRLTFVKIFPKVFSGQHTDHPAVHIERVKKVSIDAPRIIGYADGESIGPLPLEISIEPASVPLWV